jgi:hypothetical protein
MANRVSLLSGYPEQDLGEKLDWQRVPNGDWQWTTHLSRHYWLLPLAWLYRATGQANYAEKIVSVLLDWLAQYPDGTAVGLEVHGGGKALASVEGMCPGYCDGPWTSLSAHARFDHWTLMFQLLWDAPVMTNQVVAPLVLSLLQAHRQIMLEYPRRMNQFMSIGNSLFHYKVYYPQFSLSEETAAEGLRRLEQWSREQIYPDGSLAECSPNYAAGCTIRLHGLIVELGRHDYPVPPLFVERLKLAQRYFALSSDPQGCTPRIAKGGGDIRANLAHWNTTLADPQCEYVASAGNSGEKPPELNYLWPWAGHIALRSAWDKKATWLFFDAGPRGSGHMDLACLGIQIKSGGDWILVDPGFYSYSGSGWGATMAQGYLHTTWAHNTATVDGQIQYSERWKINREPCSCSLREKDGIAFASGEFTDGYGANGEIKVSHRREIHFDAGENSFVILDSFAGEGTHRITLNWQLPAQAKPTLNTTTQTVTYALAHSAVSLCTEAGDVELECAIFCGSKEPLAGWFSEHYGDLQKAVSLRMSASGGLPLQFKTKIKIIPHDS